MHFSEFGQIPKNAKYKPHKNFPLYGTCLAECTYILHVEYCSFVIGTMTLCIIQMSSITLSNLTRDTLRVKLPSVCEHMYSSSFVPVLLSYIVHNDCVCIART